MGRGGLGEPRAPARDQGGEEGAISERMPMRMTTATVPIATCHWEPTLRQACYAGYFAEKPYNSSMRKT